MSRSLQGEYGRSRRTLLTDGTAYVKAQKCETAHCVGSPKGPHVSGKKKKKNTLLKSLDA